MAVDTVTSDLVLTDTTGVGNYLELYRRMQEAALTPADSLDLLATVAEDLTNAIGA